MKVYKRALSNAQSNACENAKHPVCRCRCGGRLHGRGHAQYQAAERQILADNSKIINEEQITEAIDNIIDNLAKVE